MPTQSAVDILKQLSGKGVRFRIGAGYPMRKYRAINDYDVEVDERDWPKLLGSSLGSEAGVGELTADPKYVINADKPIELFKKPEGRVLRKPYEIDENGLRADTLQDMIEWKKQQAREKDLSDLELVRASMGGSLNKVSSAPMTKSPLRVSHKDAAAALKRTLGAHSNTRSPWSGSGVKVDVDKLFSKQAGVWEDIIAWLRSYFSGSSSEGGAGSSAASEGGAAVSNSPEELQRRYNANPELWSRSKGHGEPPLRLGGLEMTTPAMVPGAVTGPLNMAMGVSGRDAGQIAGGALDTAFGVPAAKHLYNVAKAGGGLASGGGLAALGSAAASEVPTMAIGGNLVGNTLYTAGGMLDSTNPATRRVAGRLAEGIGKDDFLPELRFGWNALKTLGTGGGRQDIYDSFLNAWRALGHSNVSDLKNPGANLSTVNRAFDPTGNIAAIQAVGHDATSGWDMAKRTAGLGNMRQTIDPDSALNSTVNRSQGARLNKRIEDNINQSWLGRMFSGSK